MFCILLQISNHYRKNYEANLKFTTPCEIACFSLHSKLRTQAATEYSHVHTHKFFRDHGNSFFYFQATYSGNPDYEIITNISAQCSNSVQDFHKICNKRAVSKIYVLQLADVLNSFVMAN